MDEPDDLCCDCHGEGGWYGHACYGPPDEVSDVWTDCETCGGDHRNERVAREAATVRVSTAAPVTSTGGGPVWRPMTDEARAELAWLDAVTPF